MCMLKMAGLQFERDKEEVYRRSILHRIVLVSRIGLAVGAVAVPAFLVNDLMFDPMAQAAGIRLALALVNGLACAALFHPVIRKSPDIVRAMMICLFPLYSLGLVLISASYEGGFLVNVPGYVQVMVFIPIVCFSFMQALGILTTMVVAAVSGAMVAGASDIALMNLVHWLVGSSAFALGAAYFIDRMERRAFDLEQALGAEKMRSDALLQNILPERIAERLKRGETPIADHHDCVTVLFADIVGFTRWSRGISPGQVVSILNDLFSEFDALAERHGAEKIKTIGDGYMAVAGLRKTREAGEAAGAIADLALDMRTDFVAFRDAQGLDLSLRIGVHSGPVVAGVIGVRKIAFDLWGDTVNVASRLENSCPPGEIQISAQTAALIGARFKARSCGAVEIAGHDSREVFLLCGRADGTGPQRVSR